MNSKVFTFALTMVLGAGLSVARAQDQPMGAPGGQMGHGRGPMDPEQQVRGLQTRLGLSDDQVNQLRPILADQRKQMMAARQDSSLQGADRAAKMRSIREDSEAKIAAVLTPDQKAKFMQMHSQAREHMQHAPASGDAPMAPQQ